MKTLIVTPTSREAAALGPRYRGLICGGGAAAGESVAARIAEEKPDLVVLAGYCGALDPSLHAGSLILCRHALAPGEEPLEPHQGAVERVRHALKDPGRLFVYSRLLTVAKPVASKRRKTDLWNEHGAGGVDMETYGVARACADAGVPWLALRAVLDPAGQTLPKAAAQWAGEADEVEIRKQVLRSPLKWPAYGRLVLELRHANKALHEAFPTVLAAAEDGWQLEPIELTALS